MIKVGIVGGTGYTGVELLRLLAVHPGVELKAITSRGDAGLPVAEVEAELLARIEALEAEVEALKHAAPKIDYARPVAVAAAFVRLASGTRPSAENS